MSFIIAILWYILALFSTETESSEVNEVSDVIKTKSATEEVATTTVKADLLKEDKEEVETLDEFEQEPILE